MTTVWPLLLCFSHMTMRMSRKLTQPHPWVPGPGRKWVRQWGRMVKLCLSEHRLCAPHCMEGVPVSWEGPSEHKVCALVSSFPKTVLENWVRMDGRPRLLPMQSKRMTACFPNNLRDWWLPGTQCRDQKGVGGQPWWGGQRFPARAWWEEGQARYWPRPEGMALLIIQQESSGDQ